MKSDLHENRTEFFLQASRTFLNPPKPPKTSENPICSETIVLEKPENVNDYFHLSVVLFSSFSQAFPGFPRNFPGFFPDAPGFVLDFPENW